jgi:hypothetical protein
LGPGGGVIAAIITFCRAANRPGERISGWGRVLGWLRTRGAGHPRAVGGRRAGPTAAIRRCLRTRTASRRCHPRHLRVAFPLQMTPTIADLSGAHPVQRGRSAVTMGIQARRPNALSARFRHALRSRPSGDRNRIQPAAGRLPPGHQAAGPVGLPKPNRSNQTNHLRRGGTGTVSLPKALRPRATGMRGPLHPRSPRTQSRDPIEIAAPTTVPASARQEMCTIRRRDRRDIHRRRRTIRLH